MKKSGNYKRQLSFCLHCCHNEVSDDENWSCAGDFELILVNQDDDEKTIRMTMTPRTTFNKSAQNWGWKEFIAWNDLINPEEGYIKNDTVIFKAYF
jgi:ubiquitin carboxyl-terminal hydrolase 7